METTNPMGSPTVLLFPDLVTGDSSIVVVTTNHSESPSVLSVPDSVTAGNSSSVVVPTNPIGKPSVPSFPDLVTGDSSIVVVTTNHSASPNVLSVPNSNSAVVVSRSKHGSTSVFLVPKTSNQLPVFDLVQNGKYMEYSDPKLDFCEEFLYILRELPSQIQSELSYDYLYDILQKEEMKTTNVQNMSLVFIDSCKFEIFLSNDSGSIRLFDELIMTPYLTQWPARKFREIKTTSDFYDKLLKYIKIFFPENDIHAVSFLLHFPGVSKECQWSHVDGTRKMLQGSIMCGDGHATTLEFSELEPRVSNAEVLSKVWPSQPEGCDVFSKMASNTNCKDLIETYDHVLHDESSKPLNPIAIQAQDAPKGCESNFMDGTVIRMNGDTIHAGPPSCPTRCRGFFLSGS
jgi:hypothetical protein